MKKRLLALICISLLSWTVLGGCGSQTAGDKTQEAVPESVIETTETAQDEAVSEVGAQLADGVYTAKFKSDSSMFHVNEACDGRGTLTVENGQMTIHISLVSKNIVNLYCGLAEEAEGDEANWLLPTEDEVTYDDGYQEIVYGFDLPVPALDEEFQVALLGTKGTWYDHTVVVSEASPAE